MPTSAHTFVIHEGRRFSIAEEKERGWRLRSRSKFAPIDVLLGLGTEAWARKRALEVLRGDHVLAARPKRSAPTVAEMITEYEKMPKRAGKDSETTSIARMRSAIRLVFEQEPEKVKLDQINPKFWLAFSAKKQGLAVADLSTRRVENIAINAAMRQAAALLAPKLRPAYEDAGISIRPDATVIQWLPESEKEHIAADDTGLIEAWKGLQKTDLALWICIGLARFAGLRRDEIEHCQSHWLEDADGLLKIRLKDRPSEGWLNKTGRSYSPKVINAELADVLRSLPAGYVVNPKDTDRARWFERVPQVWLRPFVGKVQKPLHRLRGLYADHVAKLEEESIAARIAAEKAASEALGHTSTATTKKHYLSGG